jgi:hypothetical protein
MRRCRPRSRGLSRPLPAQPGASDERHHSNSDQERRSCRNHERRRQAAGDDVHAAIAAQTGARCGRRRGACGRCNGSQRCIHRCAQGAARDRRGADRDRRVARRRRHDGYGGLQPDDRRRRRRRPLSARRFGRRCRFAHPNVAVRRFAVWSSRRRGLALAAVLLWIAAAGITTTTLAGFIGVNGDAFLTGRETAATERSLVLERVARLRAERGAISESRPVGVILVAIRNAAKSVIDDERAALLVARRRDQIDADLAVLEGTIRALPPTSIADPASNTIAGVVHLFGGVAIAAATLQRVRFALLLALPLLGGAVLAIGGALVGRRAP